MSEAQSGYLLRWRFDYINSPSRVGMWSQPGNIDQAGAWKQNGAGLHICRAMVEGKHAQNRTTEVLAEVPGQDFVMFQWLALARVNAFGLSGSVVPRTVLGGLQIVTREEIITVMINGLVKREFRSDDHKTLALATYGK